MREYLFRGKRKDNGEWVEGFLYCFYNYTRAVAQILTDRTNGIPDATEVDPVTVGQYVGLKDENGTRVYEGDVIERRSSRRNYRDAVVAEEWNCGCCSDVYGFSTYKGVVSLRDNFVVIGNIHDNPELLKKGGE